MDNLDMVDNRGHTTEDLPQRPEHAEEVDCDLLSLPPCPVAIGEDERLVNEYLALQARYESNIARIRAGADAMIRREESKLRSLEYMRGSEVRAATARLISGKKQKSVQTVYGTAGYRRIPERLAVVDEAAVPSEFRKVETKTVESIDRIALTKRYKESGEVPAGCDVKPAEEAFYTKPITPASQHAGEQQEKSA